MSTDFATLNADLLHLCLSHLHESGQDVARAGATFKHWRAVASTDRLWRELCIKRWPSTAKLPLAPIDHLAFYKMRSPAPLHSAPRMDINRVSLLVDGHASGGHNISEVLSFADAVKSEQFILSNGFGASDTFEVFEWSVPAMREFAPKYLEYIDASNDAAFGVQFLRDDGKVARERYFMNSWSQYLHPRADQVAITRSLDLEPRAEHVSLDGDNYYHITLEAYPDGKLRAFFSWHIDNEEQHCPRRASVVAALLDWA